MRLLACHIENFGILHDFDHEFTDGLNIFCRENGFGKSTFSAFIRAMFFGLDEEKGRKREERKKYDPWQGGMYGGWLDIEVHGKKYRITREFKDKTENDTFELRDLSTESTSNDYSKNIGEEIFKINKDSFERTVFIGQNDCATMATDDINAKIGNLTDNTNDINNYESAQDKIKQLMNELTPNRATGTIKKRENRITELRVEAETLKDVENVKEQVILNREGEREKKKTLTEEKDALIVEQKAAYEMGEAKAKQEELRRIQSKKKEAYEKLAAVENVFKCGVPLEEEITDVMTCLTESERAAGKLDALKFTPEEDKRLSDLSEIINDEPFVEEEYQSVISQADMIGKLHSRSKDLSDMVSAQEKRPSFAWMGWIGSMLTIAGGLIFLYTAEKLVGIGTAVGGLVIIVGFLIACLAVHRRYGRKDREQLAQWRMEIKELLEQIKSIEDLAVSYLAKYSVKSEPENIQINMRNLQKNEIDYANLKEKKSLYVEEKKSLESCLKYACDFFDHYGFVATNNYGSLLENIKGARQEYLEAQKNLVVCEQDEATFLSATDPKLLEMQLPTKNANIRLIEMKIADVTHEIEECDKNIRSFDNRLVEINEQIERRDELLEKINSETELVKKERKKYDHLSLTSNYLKEAKEKLITKYVEPIKVSFKKYFNVATANNGMQFMIEPDTSITVMQYGKQRETETLSVGFKDVVGVCLRFAYTASMYKDEKPFLVLDDPFVNLDDGKKTACYGLLSNLGEEYQIVYFTCSKKSAKEII